MCAIARGSLRLTRAHAIGVAGLEYLLPAVQRIARNAYAFNQHNEEPVQQSKVHMHMHENNINDNELEHSLVELKESHFPERDIHMHAYCNYTWQGGQPWPACTIVEYAIRGRRSITLRSAHRKALKRRRHRHTLKTAHTDEASNSFLTSCEHVGVERSAQTIYFQSRHCRRSTAISQIVLRQSVRGPTYRREIRL